MADPQSLLERFLGNDRGGFARGAAAGGLAGLILGGKGGRRLVGNTAKLAGVAVVGGLAYKAWKDWETKKQAEGAPQPHITTAPSDHTDEPVFLPMTGEENTRARKLIRAMLFAAKADGHIDDAERKRINDQLAKMDLDEEDRAFVMAELEAALDIDALARSADGPEEALEIYTASLLVLDEQGEAERAYLAGLAGKLELDPDLIAQIHIEVRHSTEKAPVQI